jgi:hypothetical protein
LREPVFRGVQADTVKIFHDFIEPLNSSLQAIFGNNLATTIQVASIQSATPTTPAKPVFRKGDALINYDLLSHGEKQVVILLLNFIVRKKYYEDSIIFIDEMDCHLNTTLQFNLLKEIVTQWIPDTAQLWTASHALGFIDYARSSKEAATIDFDLLDFDVQQTLVPVPKENLEVYNIAIPKHLASTLLENRTLVLCENQNDKYYNVANISQMIFSGVTDARTVFLSIKQDNRFNGLRDRDFLSDAEIERLERKYLHYHILRYYDFENYLYHPNNIAELSLVGFNESEYRAEILRQKKAKYDYINATIVSSRQGYEELKTDDIRDKTPNSIIDDFKSDDFERFYKFFDMKKQFDKSTILEKLNLSKEFLVRTQWFKTQIAEILENKI